MTLAELEKAKDESLAEIAEAADANAVEALCQKGLYNGVPWRKDVIDEDVRFADGLMYPSDRPGLGIELNEEEAAAHPKADHWLRHYVGTLTNIRPPDSVSYWHG